MISNGLPAQYLFEGQAPEGYQGQVVYLDILDEWDDFRLISDQMTLQRASIDSTGYFRLQGSELPQGKGFYRLRYADKEELPVSMNFMQRHFVHFLASPRDSLTFTGLSLSAPLKDNRLVDVITAKLDVLVAEERHAETNRLLTLIDERRREFLAANFSDASPESAIYRMGNWPGEGPPLGLLQDLETKLLNSPQLRPSYLHSLRKRIGALNGEYLRRRNRKLSWLLGISLLANIAFFLWWWLQPRQAHIENPEPNFTAKEVEVLDLITAGNTNKEIATALFISTATVKTHVNNIYKKAGLSSRKAAIAYGRKRKSNPV